MNALVSELITTLVQLMLIGVIGGAVSFYYSKVQKNRELRIDTLQRLSNLHGKFLALRYQYNAAFLKRNGREENARKRLNDEGLEQHKWQCYLRSCDLVGEFQGLRPLVAELFAGTDKQLDELYGAYQEWRRQSAGDSPVLQDVDGKSHEQFKALRTNFSQLVAFLRSRI